MARFPAPDDAEPAPVVLRRLLCDILEPDLAHRPTDCATVTRVRGEISARIAAPSASSSPSSTTDVSAGRVRRCPLRRLDDEIEEPRPQLTRQVVPHPLDQLQTRPRDRRRRRLAA